MSLPSWNLIVGVDAERMAMVRVSRTVTVGPVAAAAS